MNKLIALLSLLAVVPFSWTEEIQIKDRASISGEDLKLVVLALERFNEHKLDLSKYQIDVFEKGENYVVAFFDPKTPPWVRGNYSSDVLGFEVVISKDSKSVIESYFTK